MMDDDVDVVTFHEIYELRGELFSIFSIMRPRGTCYPYKYSLPIETDTLLYLLQHNERLKMMRGEPNNAEDNDEQLWFQFFCVARRILAVSRMEIVTCALLKRLNLNSLVI